MGAGGWEGLVLVERSVGGRPENREQQISVLYLFVLNVYMCLPACLYGCHLSAEPHRGQKRKNLLELELQTIVSCHVGDGT